MDNVTEEIKSRLDIVDVISEYIQLKPAGANFKALCPFHREKLPSFMVSPEKQIWHCFGCNKGGDIFTFVQEIEGVEFPEALRILAKKANVELKRGDSQLVSRKSKLLDILRLAALFYHQVLLRHSKAKVVRDYLKKRQVSEASIKEFQLGYAPDTWDGLLKFLKQKKFEESDIEAAGLISKKTQGSGYYDRFRNRLMFPINDVHGNVVGFTSRILPGLEDKEAAKYINTPETPLYNKSRILYGLDKAKLEAKKRDYAIIVEGNMDVITSHQAGIKNVIASSGTALTLDQVKLLKRYTPNVILAFDLDLAGQAATQRGIDIALQEEMNVKILTLAQGKDPDECIKKNPKDWIQAIKQAQPIMDYYFDFAREHFSTREVEGKKKMAELILSIIAKLGNKIEQDHWLKVLAEKIDTREASLRERIKKYAPRERISSGPTLLAGPTKLDRFILLGERLLALLFKSPQKVGQWIEKFTPEIFPPKLQPLVEAVKLFYNKHNAFNLKDFEKSVSNKELSHSVNVLLLLAAKDLPALDEKETDKEINKILAQLKKRHISQQLEEIERELKKAEVAGRKEEMTRLTEKFTQLARQLKKYT